MKGFKYINISVFLFIIISGLGITFCDSPGGSSGNTDESGKLIGIWKNRESDYPDGYRFTFYEDKTYEREIYDDTLNVLYIKDKGTYSFADNILTLNLTHRVNSGQSTGILEDITDSEFTITDTAAVEDNLFVAGMENGNIFTGGNAGTLIGTWVYHFYYSQIISSNLYEYELIFTIQINKDGTCSYSRVMKLTGNPDNTSSADGVISIDTDNKIITVSGSTDTSVLPNSSSVYQIVDNALVFPADAIMYDKQ